MATRSIHTISVNAFLDARGIQKGGDLTRKELASVRKSMRDVETPAEKLEEEFDALAKAALTDAKALDTLNKRLAQTGQRMTKQGLIVDTYGKKFKSASTKLKGFVFNLKALAAIVVGGVIARGIDRQIKKFDELQKTSDALGTSISFLTELQFVASQTSGIAADKTAKGLEKMTRRISEAAEGTGEAQAVIKELGLDAQKLADSGPERAFIAISQAMRSVTAEHDRLRIATKLFDDEQAKIHTTLALSDEAFESSRDRARELGASLSELDARKMEAVADSMGETAAALERFSQTLTVAFSVPLSQLLDEINVTLTKLGEATDKDGEIKRAIGFTDIGVGATRTIGEIGVDAVQGKFRATALLDLFQDINDVNRERIERTEDLMNVVMENESTDSEQVKVLTGIEASIQFMAAQTVKGNDERETQFSGLSRTIVETSSTADFF